jgi:hypothetical protein
MLSKWTRRKQRKLSSGRGGNCTRTSQLLALACSYSTKLASCIEESQTKTADGRTLHSHCKISLWGLTSVFIDQNRSSELGARTMLEHQSSSRQTDKREEELLASQTHCQGNHDANILSLVILMTTFSRSKTCHRWWWLLPQCSTKQGMLFLASRGSSDWS